jgi:sugar/nucleoside kinase (ribokinase family)
MKSCIIGSITQDIFLRYDTSAFSVVYDNEQQRSFILLPKGGKIEVTALTKAFGGGASNVAVSCARLGQEAAAVSLCGSDLYKEIYKHLEHEGVDATFLQKTDAHPTGFSSIIPTHDGDRIVFSYPGANAYLEEKYIPFMIGDQYDLVYVAPLHGNAQHLLPELVQFTREHAILAAVNPSRAHITDGFQHFKEALAGIDILILNASEAREFMQNMLLEFPDMVQELIAVQRPPVTQAPHLMRTFLEFETYQFTLADFAVLMQHRGPRLIVVTNGKEGVYVIADMSIYFHASSKVPVVCTLGAGDAFGSTFTAYILADYEIEEALVAGVINASHVITHYGAHEGLATHDVLDAQVKQHGISAVQKFLW